MTFLKHLTYCFCGCTIYHLLDAYFHITGYMFHVLGIGFK